MEYTIRLTFFPTFVGYGSKIYRCSLITGIDCINPGLKPKGKCIKVA